MAFNKFRRRDGAALDSHGAQKVFNQFRWRGGAALDPHGTQKELLVLVLVLIKFKEAIPIPNPAQAHRKIAAAGYVCCCNIKKLCNGVSLDKNKKHWWKHYAAIGPPLWRPCCPSTKRRVQYADIGPPLWRPCCPSTKRRVKTSVVHRRTRARCSISSMGWPGE